MASSYERLKQLSIIDLKRNNCTRDPLVYWFYRLINKTFLQYDLCIIS